jgi:hypothetical protein
MRMGANADRLIGVGRLRPVNLPTPSRLTALYLYLCRRPPRSDMYEYFLIHEDLERQDGDRSAILATNGLVRTKIEG